MSGRTNALEQAQVSLVHRQDQIELLEVAPGQLPRAQRAEVVAAAPGMVLGARVGRLAEMIDEQHPHSEASATPNTRFLSSLSWSRAFAASSNSRFFACSSIFFSSARISRAICFSDI